ncbi:MAG: DNA repair protein RecN [Candidatus Symbiobacter sp.]|nr:DNA repair protein RecN [Candidatus Symbiobacter sp.]
MIVSFGIRDFVLIERLDLAFAPGLTVLTGETGAGKSILVDCLALLLGERGDSGSVRAGAQQATVTAEFDLPPHHPAQAILAAHDVPRDAPMILRRIITRDGRSRAAINDQAVSLMVLREIGAALMEILGQFDGHGLLNPLTHRRTLDEYARQILPGGEDWPQKCREAYFQYREAQKALIEAEKTASIREKREEELNHFIAELTDLKPKPGEEAELVQRRTALQQREKILASLASILAEIAGERGASGQIARAMRTLSRGGLGAAATVADAASAALDRAATELAEAESLLTQLAQSDDLAAGGLEAIEDRLYGLRAVARKHQTQVDQLAELLENLTNERHLLSQSTELIAQKSQAFKLVEQKWHQAVAGLSKARQMAARRLDLDIARELPPLKLEKARFTTKLEPLPASEWNDTGAEKIIFEVATNPGSSPGPLNKIASGGELSRFMLALELVLTKSRAADSLVFDEVDSGVGGATAAAIGERLKKLSTERQVLVVTHSPQVAAAGDHHYHVEKLVKNGQTMTLVTPLSPSQRLEEIARMLSGAAITNAARDAAQALLSQALLSQAAKKTNNLL